MRKLLFLLIFFLSSFCYSLDFYLEPEISYKNLYLKDYLYGQSGKLNSRLDYASSYQLSAGGKALLEIKDLFIDFSFLCSLPLQSGSMYDSDWKTAGIKTNYSIHDLWVKKAFDLELFTKYKFSFSDFSVFPVAGASFLYNDYSAKKGKAWYASRYYTGLDQDYPWYSEYAKKYKVFGIDYTNYFFNTLTGLELSFDAGNVFLSCQGCISPFCYAFAVDHHLGKEGGQYYQMIQKAYFKNYYIKGQIGYKISDRASVTFSSSFLFSRKIHGDFYFGYYAEEHVLAKETSAFKISGFESILGYSYKLF